MGKPSRNLIFLFSAGYKTSGSTIMRGKQLADIARKFLGSEFAVRYADIRRDCTNSDVLLTKGALKDLEPVELERLIKKGNRLYFDPADEIIPDDKVAFAHVIVAASLCAYDGFSERYHTKPIKLVHHHVDPRVVSRARKFRHSMFRAGYFGELGNTIRTDGVSQKVDFHNVSTKVQNSRWITKLSGYSLHYAIRKPRSTDLFKPFLKGFMAAVCGANIFIQNEEKEAVRWLGEDYPFLLLEEPTEATILEHLDCIRDSFGSPEWERGLDRMRSIQARIAEVRIAGQLKDMLS